MGAPYISLDDLNYEAATCSAENFKKLLTAYRSSPEVAAMQNATDGFNFNYYDEDDNEAYTRFNADAIVDRAKKKDILIDFRAGVGDFAPKPGVITRIFEGLAARLSETPQVRELKAEVAALTKRVAEVEKQLGPAKMEPALPLKL